MQEKNIQDAANRLWHAELTGKVCKPIRELIDCADTDSAYQIQSLVTRYKKEKGEIAVGRKIGLTSKAVQKQLGVDQPDFGTLLKSRHYKGGQTVPYNELMQPKAEAEIAFTLKSNLTGQIDLTKVVQAIDYACVSIEVVGSRIEKWDIKIADTIADNASASHFILGQKKVSITDVDLSKCAMQMSQNGKIVSTGDGSACLGNPLNAVLWLANKMQEINTPLLAGEIILSGALGPVVDVNPGDVFTAEIQGFGSVSSNFN